MYCLQAIPLENRPATMLLPVFPGRSWKVPSPPAAQPREKEAAWGMGQSRAQLGVSTGTAQPYWVSFFLWEVESVTPHGVLPPGDNTHKGRREREWNVLWPSSSLILPNTTPSSPG